MPEEIRGRELAEFPEHVTYNFGCPCGWWGIGRIPMAQPQVQCPGRCGAVYRHWREREGDWRLALIVQ